MKRVNGSNEAAKLLETGPIDVVDRGAGPTLALGYSTLELARAGLSVEQARALGITIDPSRTTGIGANVLRLRRQLASG